MHEVLAMPTSIPRIVSLSEDKSLVAMRIVGFVQPILSGRVSAHTPILLAQTANCLVGHIGDYYPEFVTEVGHIVTNDSVIDSGVDLTS